VRGRRRDCGGVIAVAEKHYSRREREASSRSRASSRDGAELSPLAKAQVVFNSESFFEYIAVEVGEDVKPVHNITPFPIR
jgi:hypothetical protein